MLLEGHQIEYPAYELHISFYTINYYYVFLFYCIIRLYQTTITLYIPRSPNLPPALVVTVVQSYLDEVIVDAIDDLAFPLAHFPEDLKGIDRIFEQNAYSRSISIVCALHHIG